jgi:rhamnosyltransferase
MGKDNPLPTRMFIPESTTPRANATAGALKASIVIPMKNPGPVFREVLAAVCRQHTSFAYDVLVVDSGSTDGSVEFVQTFGDPRVRLIQIKPAEFGHGKTRNLAVANTTGEYAVVITHDALPVDEYWLQAMVQTAEADPRIAGVFGRHIAYPSASPYTKRDLEAHFANFAAEPVVELTDRARYDQDESYRQRLHFFSDNNALLRRSVWQMHPYPDVDFAEDQIWAKHIVEAGWKKAYCADGAVYHSHDYALIEKLQRSFDESYALYRLFGYVLSRSITHMLKSWVAHTMNDLRYARRIGMHRTHLSLVLKTPLDNLARALGHYLGSRADKLPQKLRHWLSRDRRLLLGLPMSNSGGKPS